VSRETQRRARSEQDQGRAGKKVGENEMNRGKFAGWTLFVGVTVAAMQIMAQQSEVPILRPQKPIAKLASATLLVQCDMACNWELDGQAMGLIVAGGMAKARIELGQHIIEALTPDGQGRVKQDLDIKVAGQSVVRLELFQAYLVSLRGMSESLKRGLAIDEEKRYGEAKALFQTACDGGDLDGCIQLGLIDEDDQRVTQNLAQAHAAYQKACDGGFLSGCTYLGFQYLNGEGVTQDYSQARKFFQRVCDGGYRDAMVGCKYLGHLYELGHGVSQDYSRARKLYQEACDGGYFDGCTDLGNLYHHGRGVTQNYGQARDLYQRACDGEEMDGCNRLGNLYYTGQGVTQDYGQARTFYQQACDGGDVGGCSNLAQLYESGEGVAKDIDRARNYYQKACDGGGKQDCEKVQSLH
jgi:TPR repeat protein